MVKGQDPWLQTCLGRFSRKKVETAKVVATRGSRPVREDVGEFEGLIRVWHVLWQ